MMQFLLLYLWVLSGPSNLDKPRITIRPDQGQLITRQIQQAIDSCAAAGGGTVYFPKGKFLTGGLKLTSNLTMLLAEGALIQGSDNYKDYGDGKRPEALFSGDNLTNVTFEGKGTIDGVDATAPTGEEGFRGPHCIRIFNGKNLVFKDITIVRSANYAIFCNYSDGVVVRNVKIRGGHDGFHIRFGKNVLAEDCDFRTGDDAFAGNDNVNYVVRRCSVNTSCHGFRLGGQNVLIENCRIWGPGEYKHIKQNRNNTLSAFVYFSPQDANPKLQSGDWLVKNVTVEGVDNVYIYDFAGGLWQTGQLMQGIRFEGLKVKNVKKGFTVIGDENRHFQLSIANSTFINDENTNPAPFKMERTPIDTKHFFDLTNFDKLTLKNVAFKQFPARPLLDITNGNFVEIDKVKAPAQTSESLFEFQNVATVKK